MTAVAHVWCRECGGFHRRLLHARNELPACQPMQNTTFELCPDGTLDICASNKCQSTPQERLPAPLRERSWDISTSVEQIGARFGAQFKWRTDDCLLFRIAIYILELFELDEGEMLLDVSAVFESGRGFGPGEINFRHLPATIRECAEDEKWA